MSITHTRFPMGGIHHHNSPRQRIEQILDKADIQVDGGRPWDIQVHDERFFARVLTQGTLGLGESYMEGWWDCPHLDQMIDRALRARLDTAIRTFGDLLATLRAWVQNLQSPARAHVIGKRHYDIGNDLFKRMLDPRMIYSCGYWREAETLAEAQEAKLDLICRKLGMEPGMKVLDIGCGWGGAARYAAEHYGVEVVGITVSGEQARLAREMCAGFPVEIRVEDYRQTQGRFDRIFSIGMFEHVGEKNYRTYLQHVHDLLADDGLFLLHTIGGNVPVHKGDRWIERYIFPNSMLPSASQITRAYEGLFVMEDWHNFGPYYDRTLMAWHANFNRHWPEISERYGKRFFRMWNYYLLTNAGAFRARDSQLWQTVLSPHGVTGGYTRL